MYLFLRNGRVAPGNDREALEWAAGITEQVNQITGLQVGLFASVFSPEAGTLSWGSFVPDLAAIEAAGDKLQGDAAFQDNVAKGVKLGMGGLDDSLLQVLYGEPDPDATVNYVSSVQSVCANGNFARGVEVGIEIAKRADAATGTSTMFVLGQTGVYGGVGWLTGYPDIQTLEASGQTLNADAKFLEYVDKEAGKAYVGDAGATQQRIWRRIA
jgi:hypothetical protein